MTTYQWDDDDYIYEDEHRPPADDEEREAVSSLDASVAHHNASGAYDQTLCDATGSSGGKPKWCCCRLYGHSGDHIEVSPSSQEVRARWRQSASPTGAVAGRRVPQNGRVATHCVKCGQLLEYAGIAGMRCPVHGFDYK